MEKHWTSPSKNSRDLTSADATAKKKKHPNVNNLHKLPQNKEYTCKVAKSVEGAKKLIEAGF